MASKKLVCYTLGCKVNQYDTQAMRECLERAGYVCVQGDEAADVYLINTCTVTGTGDKKSMQLIRRCHRENPDAAIVVCGCLAQRAAHEVALPGVKLVLGTQRRAEVAMLLEHALAQPGVIIAVEPPSRAPFERLNVTANEGHMRAVMKIQEGCDRYCSYCVIPSVRGPIRSRPLEDIRAEARRLGDAGFAEVVLTGIHLSSYGRELQNGTTLLNAIAATHEARGILRIRLGSLEPVVVTEDFVHGVASLNKVCHQFHLALQSGSDTVLERMRRRYTSAQFLKACRMLREAFDDCSLTTDVMTGFPGETREEFEQTVNLCRAAGFSRMHVFPYSEREGTAAASMPASVPKDVRTARASELIALGKELEHEALRGRLGRVEQVLIEKRDEQGRGVGYTGGYMHALVANAEPGEMVTVRICGVDGARLIAKRMGSSKGEDHERLPVLQNCRRGDSL